MIKNLGGDLLKYGSVPCKAYRCCECITSPFTHDPHPQLLNCLRLCSTRISDHTGTPEAKILIDAHFDPLKDHGCEWTLNHRADVQKELWRLATTEKGLGKPCGIRLNARVVDLVSNILIVPISALRSGCVRLRYSCVDVDRSQGLGLGISSSYGATCRTPPPASSPSLLVKRSKETSSSVLTASSP